MNKQASILDLEYQDGKYTVTKIFEPEIDSLSYAFFNSVRFLNFPTTITIDPIGPSTRYSLPSGYHFALDVTTNKDTCLIFVVNEQD